MPGIKAPRCYKNCFFHCKTCQGQPVMFSLHFIPFRQELKKIRLFSLNVGHGLNDIQQQYSLVLGSVFHALRFMRFRQHFRLIYFTYLFHFFFYFRWSYGIVMWEIATLGNIPTSTYFVARVASSLGRDGGHRAVRFCPIPLPLLSVALPNN